MDEIKKPNSNIPANNPNNLADNSQEVEKVETLEEQLAEAKVEEAQMTQQQSQQTESSEQTIPQQAKPEVTVPNPEVKIESKPKGQDQAKTTPTETKPETILEKAKNILPNINITIPNLRTYEDDVKNAVQNQNVSTAQILIAEQQKQQKNQAEAEVNTLKPAKNKILFTLSVLFIALGVASLAYFLILNPDNSQNGPRYIINTPKFFDTENILEITYEDRNSRSILNDLAQARDSIIPQKTIEQINFTKTEDEVNGEVVSKKSISTRELFENLIESRASDQLVRSLNEEFMIGQYNSDSNKLFILLAVDDFDSVFEGMLEWEENMVKDLENIFNRELVIRIKNTTGDSAGALVSGTSTATSTSSSTTVASTTTTTKTSTTATTTSSESSQTNSATNTSTSVNATNTDLTLGTTTGEVIEPEITETIITFEKKEFTDAVIKNHDARVILDDEGNIVLYYSFINGDKNLLIATDPEISEIIQERIRNNNLIQ